MQQMSNEYVNSHAEETRQSIRPTVLAVTPSSAINRKYANYKRRYSCVIGALQITMGILFIALNFAMALTDHDSDFWLIGVGWWASPFHILAGSFGIAAGIDPRICIVTITLVFSIFSCFTIIGVIYQGSGALATVDWYNKYNKTYVAVTSLFLVCGICEFSLAALQSTFCCCGSSPAQINQGTVLQASGGGLPPNGIHSQGQNTSMELLGQNTQPSLQNGASQQVTTTGGPAGGIMNVARDSEPQLYDIYTGDASEEPTPYDMYVTGGQTDFEPHQPDTYYLGPLSSESSHTYEYL